MEKLKIAILHYSAPPVVGGVESVIQAHARLLREMDYPTTVIAGIGSNDALPFGTEFIQIPELDSNNPLIVQISQELEQGHIPGNLDDTVTNLEHALASTLSHIDLILVHNVFTKHFNLPLTAALCHLLAKGVLPRCIAWCHDFTWTSPHSRSKVYPGYPWDLLRTYRSDVTYVTVSRSRQLELAGLFGCPSNQIRVIYNGIYPDELLGISGEVMELIDRLELWDSDLNLLMPVRVTQAKNIELAIRVVAELKKQGVRPKLVVTGPPDPHDQGSIDYYQGLRSLRDQMNVRKEMRFAYEAGPKPDEPFILDMSMVGSLFRLSDVLFMPSHREGFGMPILEAGLTGMPIFCANNIPAASEIGGEDVIMFSDDADPSEVAGLILNWAKNDPVHQLRRRARQNFAWQSIFRREILPLLEGRAL
jgi:glycosyltransferase involved in cell wall biosynthesis